MVFMFEGVFTRNVLAAIRVYRRIDVGPQAV